MADANFYDKSSVTVKQTSTGQADTVENSSIYRFLDGFFGGSLGRWIKILVVWGGCGLVGYLFVDLYISSPDFSIFKLVVLLLTLAFLLLTTYEDLKKEIGKLFG